jgi:glycerophosphoryl diester phosphodiesterase
MNYWTQSKKNVWVAAHRGWCEKYPENTMEAFRAAVELGVDQIELDVRQTKDGELVIIHDALVDRTTDGTGAVADMTLAEIKALDAGIKKGEQFRGARIPTLKEFMDYIIAFPMMTVDFEFKVYPTEGQEEYAYAVCDKILAVIDEYNFVDRCVVNSFSGKLHEYILDKYGNKYKHHLFFPSDRMGEYSRDLYKNGYCACMLGNGDVMSADEDFRMLEEKYGVRCWVGAGVRDEEKIERAIKNGAELITCNNPDEVLRILREKGYHK